MPFDDHRCSAYCRDGRHAELVYSGVDDAAWVGRCYQAALTAAHIPERVVAVRPAREALPLARAVATGAIRPWYWNPDDPASIFLLDDEAAYAAHESAWLVWYQPAREG